MTQPSSPTPSSIPLLVRLRKWAALSPDEPKLRALLLEAADALDAIPSEREARWTPLTEELPSGYRPVLVTNNLGARDAHGEMSHIWLTRRVYEPDEHDEGYTAFDGDTLIQNLTHWRKV